MMLHTALGLPPLHHPTVSADATAAPESYKDQECVPQSRSTMPLGSKHIPIVQVVWIDRNAFKPNRPPYDFEAMAPVTRLKRFKTAAACVKWLNDRRNRAGCNQQVASTEPNSSASNKSCYHRTSHSGSNVIISTPSGRSNSSSILSSSAGAYRRSFSGTGPFPTIVCRVASEKEALGLADDGARRVDLRLVVSAREAAVLLECLLIEDHDDRSVASGSPTGRRCIIPPKPFRSIEVYVYHRCAFEKPRKADTQVEAAHELVAEVYPTLEDAVLMGVMDPGLLHPSGPSTAVSESSSPGKPFGLGSEKGDLEQEEEYPSYFPELRYWWYPGPQPSTAAWYVPGREVASEHQQRLVRLICAPTSLTEESKTEAEAAGPSQNNKLAIGSIDGPTKMENIPRRADGVEANAMKEPSFFPVSQASVCAAALPHPPTYVTEDSSASYMWSPAANTLLVPCIAPPALPPQAAMVQQQQQHLKATQTSSDGGPSTVLDNVYYTDPFGGQNRGSPNQVSMGMSPLAIYQYLTNLRRQRAATTTAVTAHDAEKQQKFSVCNDDSKT